MKVKLTLSKLEEALQDKIRYSKDFYLLDKEIRNSLCLTILQAFEAFKSENGAGLKGDPRYLYIEARSCMGRKLFDRFHSIRLIVAHEYDLNNRLFRIREFIEKDLEVLISKIRDYK